MVPTGCHPLAERSGLLEQAELLKQWPPLRRQHLEDQTALDGEALAEVVDGQIVHVGHANAVHIEPDPRLVDHKCGTGAKFPASHCKPRMQSRISDKRNHSTMLWKVSPPLDSGVFSMA